MKLNFNFMFQRPLPILPLCLALLSGALPSRASSRPILEAGAQSQSVSGSVVDSSGGAISGAAVSLRSRSVDERKTLSDATGRFVFDRVPGGPASLTVTLARFAPVTVDVDRTRAEVRIILKPASLSEQVTVRARMLTVPRITTATRTDTLLRDVPQAVSVVTRDLIADQRMQSIGDVVRYVPGVGIAQGEGNRDTPIFRGNSSTSDFYVDGVRDDVQYFRDLYNVERIEALKGPNGMIFGRGGVGGVINRVIRQADWTPSRETALQVGSGDDRRLTGDFGQAVNSRVALRVTGMYERSDSYREATGLERYGINPTIAFALGPNTTLRAGYEFFHDGRTTDRGILSFQGKPVVTDASTFFGNPDISNSEATVNVLSAVFEHKFKDRFTLRNRTRYGAYDKFYQNVFPGAVNAAGTLVSISGYNDGTQRQNLFNQMDLTFSARSGRLEHTLLVGMELGRQETDNLRTTAFFSSISPNTTSVNVPLRNPTTSLPVDFRPNASDADNHGVATVAALYAQDQIVVSRHVQAIVGLRYDNFTVDFQNYRTAADFSSDDGLVSPRLGLVYKPSVPSPSTQATASRISRGPASSWVLSP